MSEWRTDKPDRHGYYLGAWQSVHGTWRVSELWFNPSSGWWPDRGYLDPHHHVTDRIDVVAWMPMPAPPDQTAGTRGQCAVCGYTYSLTLGSVLRAHHAKNAASRVMCAGSGQPPAWDS